MKAMVIRRYGPPDVLRLEDVPKPVPKEHEILVQVHAASVNALDWHFLRGKPVLVRLKFGLFRPRNKILGYDIAGRVEAVGKSVTRFKPGDDVMAGTGFRLGGFAEYVCIFEDEFVAQKPGNISFEQAAAVPGAASAALVGLRDRGRVQSGQKVLINGAAGGAGTFAVQIARAFGAEVTGVCSTRNLDLVRSLGADRVIDYTREDFAKNPQAYDLLLDNVGNRSVADMLRVIRPGGTCVVVGFTSMGLMLKQSLLGPRRARKLGITWATPSEVDPTAEHMDALNELLKSGKVVPQIEKRYSLKELPEAMRHIETGHARAKIVIVVRPQTGAPA